MGRILRKKSTSLKKRKKQDADSLPAEPAEGKAGGGTEPAAVAAEDVEPTAKLKPSLVKKPQTLPAPAEAGEPADNVFTRAIQFLREVKIELKKVTWPSRKQTTGSTLVVIVLVVIISAFLGVVDMGLSGLIRAIFK